LIGILILIVLIVVGISYGWASIENILESYSTIMQVIESNQARNASELGIELAENSIGFLEDRYTVFKSNNP